MMPPSTTPHMPGTSVRRSPSSMWQVEVPMIATSRPGSTTPAAGTVTCASTLATATAMPGGRPIQPAASRGEIAGAAAERRQRRRHLGGDDIGEARVERAEIVAASGRRRPGSWLCSRRCRCCASRRRSSARSPSRRPRSGGRRRGRPPALPRESAAPWPRTTPSRSCRRSGAATLRRAPPRSR